MTTSGASISSLEGTTAAISQGLDGFVETSGYE